MLNEKYALEYKAKNENEWHHLKWLEVPVDANKSIELVEESIGRDVVEWQVVTYVRSAQHRIQSDGLPAPVSADSSAR